MKPGTEREALRFPAWFNKGLMPLWWRFYRNFDCSPEQANYDLG
jgi:hypothetical protein